MTDRKPALETNIVTIWEGEPPECVVLASDLPPAILNATPEELGAAVLAIEQFRATQERARKAAARAAAKGEK